METGGEFYFEENKKAGCIEGSLSVYEMLSGYNRLFFNSGRAAMLHFYNRCVKPKKILMPAYCCESMTQGIPESLIDFYDVNTDLSIDLDSLNDKLRDSEVKAVVFISYFGFLQPQKALETLRAAQKEGIILIEDTTHSFFTVMCTIGDYCFCSLRKWFALPDGAVYYSNNRLDIGDRVYFVNQSFYNTRYAAMKLKGAYMSGMTINKEAFRQLLKDGEKMLDAQKEPFLASEKAKEFLMSESSFKIGCKRRKNFTFLTAHINSKGITKLKTLSDEHTVPMFLPVYCDSRDELQSTLAQSGIYCPMHWPQFSLCNLKKYPKAEYISHHILSIPIDQRYSVSDMARVADAVNKFKVSVN